MSLPRPVAPDRRLNAPMAGGQIGNPVIATAGLAPSVRCAMDRHRPSGPTPATPAERVGRPYPHTPFGSFWQPTMRVNSNRAGPLAAWGQNRVFCFYRQSKRQQPMRIVVNRRELAEIFGISCPTVNSLMSAGCPVERKGGRGRAFLFDVPAIIAWRAQEIRAGRIKPLSPCRSGWTVSRAHLAKILGVAASLPTAWLQHGCPGEAGGRRGHPSTFHTAHVIAWREADILASAGIRQMGRPRHGSRPVEVAGDGIGAQ